MLNWMDKMGIKAKDVVGVFTERAPCNKTYNRCEKALKDAGIPKSKVWYTLDYPADPVDLRNFYRDIGAMSKS